MNLRVTPHRQYELGLAHSRTHFAKGAAIQEQVSTGFRINRPSDSPSGQKIILTQETLIQNLETKMGSVASAQSTLSDAQTNLLDAQTQLVKAKEIALQARQATDESEKVVLTQQLDSILNRLETIANAESNGRYLFSGTQTGTPPFTGIVEGNPQYQGSLDGGMVLIPGHANIETRYVGKSVFEPGTTTSIFQVVQDLKKAILNSEDLTSSEVDAAFERSIKDIDGAADHLRTVIGKQAVDLESIESLKDRFASLKLNAESLLGETRSTDYAEAITKLQEQQTLLQFTLQTVMTLNRVSVLDYL
ncbi:hypothetical protein SH668x_000891 [Planctomicrobium sp. SH668]|uniref:flagellin N-terminal helical domain-containing protein n=1 Tax=Planctomicrobium sp. SH668 TaxID=3448126 RepID=UPI003F5B513E